MTDEELIKVLRQVADAGRGRPAPSWERIQARRADLRHEGLRRRSVVGLFAVAASLALFAVGIRVHRGAEHRAKEAMTTTSAIVIRRHLAQSDTMIVAFQNAIARGTWNDELTARARDLEQATRDIQDGRIAADSTLAGLLADLDLVLTEIAGYGDLTAHRDAESEMIEYSIRVRNVVPRLGRLGMGPARGHEGGGEIQRLSARAHALGARARVAGAGLFTPTVADAATPDGGRTPDSLYRVGREALARREYRGAADLFEVVVSRYPAAAVAGNAQFWRAYSLYASGNATHSIRDLRDAQRALDAEEQRYSGASTARQGLDLRARVIAAEATLGDETARSSMQLAEAALAQPISCGDADLALKLVALERLVDRDPEDAMPTIRRVLSTQGPCAEEVRRLTTVVVASTPGMNATKMVDDLARADRALQVVPGAIPPIRRAPSGSDSILERDTHERWLNASEARAFTPFMDTRFALRFGVLTAADSERTLWLSPVGDPTNVTWNWTLRPTGLVMSRTELPSLELGYLSSTVRTRADSDGVARQRIGVQLHWLALPESNTWDLIPVFRPDRPTVGARWTDTLSLAAHGFGCDQSLNEIRSSQIVGDTSVDGRPLVIVRTTARLTYADHAIIDEWFIDGAFSYDRTATGHSSGRYLYDPSKGFFLRRADTVTLAGMATLRVPGGQAYTTPTAYEAIRTSRVVARDDSIRPHSGIAGLSVVPSPNPFQDRLEARDAGLRDSLLKVWDASRDPVERASLLGALRMYGLPQATSEQASELAFAAGDRGEWSAALWRGEVTPDTARVRFTLSLLSDPGRALAAGVDIGPIYMHAGGQLWQYPPILYRDVSRDISTLPLYLGDGPACLAAVCQLLAAQWHTATNPWLRDLGLLALVATDPRKWGDTLTARATAGDRYLRHFGMPSIPSPTADWTAWIDMVNNCTGPGCRAWTFEGWHGEVPAVERILFAEAWTGRDVLGELGQKAALATNDSARLVYEGVVLGLGGDGPSSTVIINRLQSSDPAQRWLGRNEARLLLSNGPSAPDSVTRDLLLDRLFGVLIGGAPAWPSMGLDTEVVRKALRQVWNGTDTIAIMRTPPVSATLRARWAKQVVLAEPPTQTARSPSGVGSQGAPEARTELQFLGPFRSGPFARVSVTAVLRQPLAFGRSSPRTALNITVYLVETQEGWRVIGIDGQ
jgi:TolA-binding protein